MVTPMVSTENLMTGERTWLKLGAAALVLLLLSLPLAHVTFIRSVAFVAMLAAATMIYVKGRRDALPLLFAFVIWFLAAILSLASLSDKAVALELIWSEVGKSAIVFFAAYVLAKAGVPIAVLFRGGAAAVALLALISIAGWIRYDSWVASGLVPSLGDYNTSVLTLFPLLALPCFSAWRKACGEFSLVIAIVAFGLALVAGLLSLSRAFWLITLLLCMLTIFALAWRSHVNRRKALCWGLLMLFICIGGMWALVEWRGIDLLHFDDRERIYGPVLDRVFGAPWYGLGYGHETQQAWYAHNMVDVAVLHAHNLVLSYIEQMGVLGIVVLIAVFGGLLHAFARHLFQADGQCSSLAALGVALVIGIFVRNNLDIFFVRHNLLLFFLVCGLMLGALEAEHKNDV